MDHGSGVAHPADTDGRVVGHDVIVLAGGGGTRLGGVDKAALEVGGRPLLHRVLEGTRRARRVVVVGATAVPDGVLRTVEERRVRLVRLWFTDVIGQIKSVAISPVELETAFDEGVQFDGSAIDGFSRVQESDVLAFPDAASFQLMPDAEGGQSTARIFCDIANLDGTPFGGDPRGVLKRNLTSASEQGFEFMCAPEIEYFYLRSDDPEQQPEPVDDASYFDLTAADEYSDLRRRTISRLEASGIPVEYAFHEDAPSQHEIDLRYSDALAMADSITALRMIVREVAMSGGVHATFMPKPIEGVQGSGMHTHMSLWEGDRNAFHDPEDEVGLSDTARRFIAGLLRHAPEITAVTNQTVNSYKRLWGGDEAPSYVCWGHNNRSALVRVPLYKPGKGNSTRVDAERRRPFWIRTRPSTRSPIRTRRLSRSMEAS